MDYSLAKGLEAVDTRGEIVEMDEPRIAYGALVQALNNLGGAGPAYDPNISLGTRHILSGVVTPDRHRLLVPHVEWVRAALGLSREQVGLPSSPGPVAPI